jgi:tetratricopeptide (TPR) repeat protein
MGGTRMLDLLQLVVAVAVTKIGSDAWEALIAEGSSFTLQKVQDALKQAASEADTTAAIGRAEASLQLRPSTAVRALLNAIDPSKCQSVCEAVRGLAQDPDGSRLRAQLQESFTLCSPRETLPDTINDAVEAFYVAVLEALYVSESPLRVHAELLHGKWQHAQTRALVAVNKSAERVRATIAKIRQYKEAGQISVAEALVRDLDGDDGPTDSLLRAELLTLSADLLEEQGRLADAASKLLESRRLAPDHDITRTHEFRAHELLGKTQQAELIARQLREKYPICPRCYVAYLRTAPAGSWRDEVANLALELSLDWRVEATIASRALAEHDAALALERARKATELKPDRHQAWYLTAQAVAVLHDATTVGQPSASNVAFLEQGLDAADRCITILQNRERTSTFEAKALALKASLFAALGRKEKAAATSERAYHLAPQEPDALVQYARTLDERGEQSASIELLDNGRTAGNYDIDLLLAQLLLRRAQPGDAAKARGLLLPIALQATPIFKPYAVGLVFTAASRDEQGGADRIQQLAEALSGACDPAWISVLKAAHALRQGEEEEATAIALRELPTSHSLPLPYRRNLASILTETQHFTEALPLWQRVARESGEPGDVRNLLFVALKLEQHDLAMEIFDDLRKRGVSERDLLNHEIELLERYRPLKAVDVLEQHLAQHANDRVARLRLSLLGVRLDRPDLIDADVNAVPEVTAATPQQARAAVHLLRHAQKNADAIKYSYRALRLNFGDADAHAAYRDSVMLSHEHSLLDAPPAVRPGSAVRYVTESDEPKWLIIEEEDPPDIRLDEAAPDSPLCKRLLGVRVGDRFLLRDTFGIEQFATVTELKSKYLFRFHDVLANTQHRFPAQRGFTSISLKRKADGDIDIARLFELIPRNSALGDVEADYLTKPLPLQLFVIAGKGDRFDAFLHLLDREGLGPRCCTGTAEELTAVEATLKTARRIVVDTTGLLTAFFSESWSLLDMNAEFIVTTGTLELIRSKGPRAFALLPSLPMLSHGPRWTRSAREVGLKLDEFLGVVAGKATVAEADALARLSPDRREQLARCFGSDCAEAMALAAERQAVFWTDDFAAGLYAERVLGVARVWTQAVARFGIGQGAQGDPEFVGTLTAALLGWRYAFTSTNSLSWQRAGRIATWSASQWPLRGALAALSAPEMGDEFAVPIAAEMIAIGCLELVFPPARNALVSSIVDAVGHRKAGFALVRRLLQHLQSGFGVHAIAAEEAKEVVRSWLATTTQRAMSQPPIVTG